jgi:FHS family L-fucose permease-like MFS transporter
MMIVGGAVCPVFMGWIADVSNMAIGFLVPLICFIFIAWFGYSGYKVRTI